MSESMAIILFILLFFVHGSSLSTADTCSFSYSYFQPDNTPFLKLSGDARLSRGAAQVSLDSANSNTPTTSWGWVVDSRPLQFKPSSRDHYKGNSSASFNTKFHINMQVDKNNRGVGGGMAFVLVPYTEQPNTGSDRSGKWLGVYNQSINGQRSNNIVGVELDTYQDVFDPDNNHVGLDLNNITSFRSQSLLKYGINLSDGNKNITVWIDYDGAGKRLDVFMVNAGVTAASNKSEAKNVLSISDIDLGKHTADVVYAGFTGSSGDAIDLHCLLSWEFSMACFDTFRDNRLSRSRVAIIAAAIVAAALIGIILLILMRSRNRRKKAVDSILTRMEAGSLNIAGPQRFSYKELSKATGSFSRDNKLGRGASGMVYKAALRDKRVVAVKKISCEGVTEFMAELSSISKLRHRNILPLIGWSFNHHSEDEMLLVYQYMPKGSLDRWLFRSTSAGAQPCRGILDWGQRYQVLCGTAAALVYLHEGWEQTVIHRDVKASNIMLDSDFTPRLGDFGLARVAEHGLNQLRTANPAGTPGYIPPEVFETGIVSIEADVYSFGIVVLEVVCGRRPVYTEKEGEQEHCRFLLDWVWDLYLQGKLVEAVDRRLAEGSYEEAEIERILNVGLVCANPNMKERPSMSAVLQELTSLKGPSSFRLPSCRPRYNNGHSHNLVLSSAFLVSSSDGNLTSTASASSVAQVDQISLILPR